jgi:hypothetical protein
MYRFASGSAQSSHATLVQAIRRVCGPRCGRLSLSSAARNSCDRSNGLGPIRDGRSNVRHLHAFSVQLKIVRGARRWIFLGTRISALVRPLGLAASYPRYAKLGRRN